MVLLVFVCLPLFFSFALCSPSSLPSLEPTSLIPHLERLSSLFLADTPVLALTATRRLRVPEGRQAVEIAIDFLRQKSPESELTYSFGMSEAARAKFGSSAESLTDRLKSRGQWTGTCSDFVQLGVEDLDAHTIISLMIISAGDPKRQIRDRIFSSDKNAVGIAIGSYKQSTAVAVTLASKFVQNTPTDDLERQARGASQQDVSNVNSAELEDVTAATREALAQANRIPEDEDATEQELAEQRDAQIARLEQHNNYGNASISQGDEDEEMAAIQRDRMAAMAALEKGQYQQSQSRYNESEEDSDEPPPHMQAYDPSIESYEEAEARKAAFLAQIEREKAEAIAKAEEAGKNKWKAERAAREAAKKKEEEDRLARLQQGGGYQYGPRPTTYGSSSSSYSSQSQQSAPAPVNRSAQTSVMANDNPEMDELQRERMAKIAALEGNSAYSHSSSTSGMEDDTHVVGQSDDSSPADYDPTRESFEEAEERKRQWFAEQDRKKQEAIKQAEETGKNRWKAERAAREAAKKKEEEDRLARLRSQDSNPRKLGGGGYGGMGGGGSSSYSNYQQKSPRDVPAPTNIVRQPSREKVQEETSSSSTTTSAASQPYYGSQGTGGVDNDDRSAASAEEERIMRTLGSHGIAFGREDPRKKKEEEMAVRKAAAEARTAQMKKKREEKWAQETAEAEKKAAARIAEAQAKAAALQAGTLNPDMVSPRPSGEARAPPVESAREALPDSNKEESVPESIEEEAVSESNNEGRGQGEQADAVSELQSASVEQPVTLYLNALYRDEDSTSISSLDELREGVSYWSSTGHKVARVDEYNFSVGDETIRIPAEQLMSDDFNTLSDYFFFGTAPHLTLYPSPEGGEAMHVSDLTTLSPGVLYYLASGNNVEVIGGADPKMLLNGEKEVTLPEEVAEQLRY